MFTSSHVTVALGIDSAPPNPRYNVGGEARLDPLPKGINFASPNIVVGVWGIPHGCWRMEDVDAPGPANWQNKFYQPTGKRVSKGFVIVRISALVAAA